MRAFVMYSGILFSLNGWAVTAPASSSPAAWQNVCTQAAASSQTSVDENGAEYHSLQRLSSPNSTTSARADYFSVVGHTETQGAFHVDHIEIVAENWQMTADQVRTVDQWAYALSVDGRLTFVMHQQFSLAADGTVLSDNELSVPADLNDPGLQTQLNAKLQEWEQSSAQ